MDNSCTMTIGNCEYFESKPRFVLFYHIKNFFKRICNNIGLGLSGVGNAITVIGMSINSAGAKLVKKSRIVPTSFLKMVKVENPTYTTSSALTTICNDWKVDEPIKKTKKPKKPKKQNKKRKSTKKPKR